MFAQGRGNKGVGHEISSWKRTGYPIGICAITGIGEKPLFQHPLQLTLDKIVIPLENRGTPIQHHNHPAVYCCFLYEEETYVGFGGYVRWLTNKNIVGGPCCQFCC